MHRIRKEVVWRRSHVLGPLDDLFGVCLALNYFAYVVILSPSCMTGNLTATQLSTRL